MVEPIKRPILKSVPINTGDLILSGREFVAGFIPPDYHVDGVLQKRFIYSLTAPTGAGKTAILMLLAVNTAMGKPIGDHHVERGRVLYLAGENPDDIRMRWMPWPSMSVSTSRQSASISSPVFLVSTK